MHVMHEVQYDPGLHDERAVRQTTAQETVAHLTYDVRLFLVL
jgi:hypothetical protein